MISINVDEAALRDMRPELNTTAAISLWVQQLVDHCMQQMRMESGLSASISGMTQAELWRTVEQDSKLTLKPSVISMDNGEAIDLETFRADLHKMVEEIYAET